MLYCSLKLPIQLPLLSSIQADQASYVALRGAAYFAAIFEWCGKYVLVDGILNILVSVTEVCETEDTERKHVHEERSFCTQVQTDPVNYHILYKCSYNCSDSHHKEVSVRIHGVYIRYIQVRNKQILI